jgi:hypothetical protein
MKSTKRVFAVALPMVFFAGCVSLPNGPRVMALPGTGKTFEQFRSDDAMCRNYAQDQIGGAKANDVAVDAGARSAVLGTVIGAVAGAAIGGSRGAGVGAGTGLLMGTAVGAGAAETSVYGLQRSYDHAYLQCMYANGERVPISGSYSRNQVQAAPAAGTPYPPPPPPPGTPPPPPAQ